MDAHPPDSSFARTLANLLSVRQRHEGGEGLKGRMGRAGLGVLARSPTRARAPHAVNALKARMNSQDRPLLIIINGAAGAGKSTLATVIPRRLRLPLLSEDNIKEAIADVLGADDRAASQKLGIASFAVMRALAQRYLDRGVGAILAAPFHGQTAKDLGALAENARSVILSARLITGGCIHEYAIGLPWVHFDIPRPADERFETWHSPDLAAAEPPEIGVPVFTVNTVDGYAPSIEAALAYISAQLGTPAA